MAPDLAAMLLNNGQTIAKHNGRDNNKLIAIPVWRFLGSQEMTPA